MIKAIIWDWGRTLYDSRQKLEYPESDGMLKYCQEKGYRQVLVSLVSPDGMCDLPERIQQIENSKLLKYFEKFLATDQSKDDLYDQIIKFLNLPKDQIIIIDDRTIRGIKYANHNGLPSIWLQKGDFANELPTAETGQPTYTVKSLEEIKQIL